MRRLDKKLGLFDEMLGAAIRREQINAGTFRIRETLYWWEWPASSRALGRRQDTYYLGSEVFGVVEWKHLARRALAYAIRDAGYLLKACPAPASRGEAGESCGTLFVANRPNQEYCSATCQTRASTRAARRGEETPVVRKRREQAATKKRKK